MIIHSRKTIRPTVAPAKEQPKPKVVKPEKKKKVYREQPVVIVEQIKKEKIGE